MSQRKKEKDKAKKYQAPKEDRRKNRMTSLVIFAFAFFLYSNTFLHGYVLDDDVVYRKNSFVQQGLTAASLKGIFTHSFIYGFNGHNDQSYRPLVLVCYAFEKSLFGDSPHTQHFINVLLFGFCCILVFRVMKKLLKNFSLPVFSVSGFEISVPFLGAVLFAVHPIHTEVVADIKGLDEILNLMFLCLSLLGLFRHIETGEKKPFYFSILFFFLSLLCKEMAVTFLAIIPLTVFFFKRIPRKQFVSLVVFLFSAFGIYMLIRTSVLDTATFDEKMKVVNNGLAAATNGADRIATAIFMLGKYVLLLFFPHPLSWDYSYNQIPILSFSDIRVIATIVVFILLAGFAVIRTLLSKAPATTRQPATAVYAYSIFFFFIAMSVVSNIFILIGATMAERFLFTPSLAFCLALPFFLQRFGKNVLLSVTAAAVILFSFKTFSRNSEWQNNFTLFAAGVEATPNSSRAESALGSAYREQAEQEPDQARRNELYQKAIGYYQKAIEILPENTEALYNAGVSYYAMGDRENALKLYEQALKVSPDYTNAANNSGVIYFERQDYTHAKTYFEQALKYAPGNADALGNLGAIYHNLGNLQEAINYYQKALAINPANTNIRANLEKAEKNLGGRK